MTEKIAEAVRVFDNALMSKTEASAWQTLKAAVLAQQTTNKQSTPLCSACGVELSCRNHCHDTNSPHGIVAI
jgi:hypothetical protein